MNIIVDVNKAFVQALTCNTSVTEVPEHILSFIISMLQEYYF